MLLLCLVSAYGVADKLFSRYEARQRMEALQKRVSVPVEIIPIYLADTEERAVSAGPAPTATPGAATPTPAEAARCESLRKLREENGDFVGWITLPGTLLDYPVMQSTDRPWYYLDRDFARQRSRSGLPFIEESCDLAGNRANLILYGHNMKNGSMFGALHKLIDAEFYEKNRVLTFDTPERTGQYRIFSVFYMTVGDEGTFQFYRYSNLPDKAALTEYVEKAQACSLHGRDMEIGENAELLTLVTCKKNEKDGRLVVVAARVT